MSVSNETALQAFELQALVKNIQERLNNLQPLDSIEDILQECERLELEVCEAAEKAIKQIDNVEKNVLMQIGMYRQQCFDALNSKASP